MAPHPAPSRRRRAPLELRRPRGRQRPGLRRRDGRRRGRGQVTAARGGRGAIPAPAGRRTLTRRRWKSRPSQGVRSRRVLRQDPHRDDPVAGLRARPRRADPALQRGLRAGHGLPPRRGARPRRARPRDPAGGARGVRRVPDLRLADGRPEPAGRPLADQAGPPAADRLVQPPDARARRRARGARDDGHRPDRPREPEPRRRGRARRRPGRQARRDRPPGDGAAGAAPGRDAGRLRGEPRSGCSPRSPRAARACSRSTPRRSCATRPTARPRCSAATTATTSTSSASASASGPTRTPRSRACARPRAPARVDDWGGLTGEIAEAMFRTGYRSTAAAPIVVAGALWGAVAIASEDPLPPDSENRLGAFCELASLAVASAQARADLTASRARVVKAGDEQRRRLERNLHDGAQQRLVSVALMLRLAQARLGPEAEAAAEAARRRLARARHRPGGAARARPRPAPRRARRPRAAARDRGADRAAADPGRRRRGARGAAARRRRGDGVLHRRRGADQRHPARGGDGARSRSAATAPSCASRSPTTGAAARTPPAAPASSACATARRPRAGR